MMLNSWSCLTALICCCSIWLSGSSDALQPVIGNIGMSNSLAAPGQPMYYLMADAGPTVDPNEELKRTNRSLMKWWEDLFGQQNNCCNNNNNLLPNNNNLLPYNNNNLVPNLLPNNCNGLQLQNLDPFKQMKLFKKLPDLFGNNCGGQCNQCGGQQPVNNYAAPVAPAYGGEGPAVPAAPADYNPAPAPPSGGYETPNPAYDGPGDGDASYVAPVAPPPPATDSYVEPPATDYAPAPPAPPTPNYEAPALTPPPYEPAAPAPESYSKVDDYAKPEKSYGGGGGAQQPQIVYQPIIYLTASPGAKADVEFKTKPQEQSYEAQTEPPQPLPVYEPPAPSPAPPPAPVDAPVYAPPSPPVAAPAPYCNTPACAGYLPLLGVPFYSYPAPPVAPPAPVYAAPPPAQMYAPPPVAPPAPSYTSSACQTPIRLSLHDQPYRVAPELFREYNYRLSLADNNSL